MFGKRHIEEGPGSGSDWPAGAADKMALHLGVGFDAVGMLTLYVWMLREDERREHGLLCHIACGEVVLQLSHSVLHEPGWQQPLSCTGPLTNAFGATAVALCVSVVVHPVCLRDCEREGDPRGLAIAEVKRMYCGQHTRLMCLSAAAAAQAWGALAPADSSLSAATVGMVRGGGLSARALLEP